MSVARTEETVRNRYTEGARSRVAELCCPVDYDPRFLEVIPPEVLSRDYGCGDPSRHLEQGETVLDLGSGTGKICFIAAQVVGSSGKVIGISSTSRRSSTRVRSRRSQTTTATGSSVAVDMPFVTRPFAAFSKCPIGSTSNSSSRLPA